MSITDRREFLRASTLATASAAIPIHARAAIQPRPTAKSCIWINLIGGPAGIDTWDPKPDASASIRSPFAAIPTTIPGIYFTELFPRMAAMANRLAIMRSIYHQAMPIHETGLQLLQTGQLARGGIVAPHIGSEFSTWKLIGGPLGHLGVSVSKGQDSVTATLPAGSFAESCQTAVNRLEQGDRFLTINMFNTVYDQPTWDCHADHGSLASNLDDYRHIGPMFDRVFTDLLTDLEQRGLLESTLIVAVGEIGRTPQRNERGGRDHWNGCWTGIVAGGGVRGGQVIGASDAIGAYATDRPIEATMIPASVLHALGVTTPDHLANHPVIAEWFH